MLLLRGELFVDWNDSTASAALLRLATKPNDTNALKGLADYYFEQKKPDSSLLFLNLLQEHDSSNPALLYKRAYLHYRLNEIPQADSLLRVTLIYDSGNTEAQGLLLAVWYKEKNTVGATELAERLILKNPTDFTALLFRGLLYRNEKNFAAAREIFDRCLQLFPSYPLALELRAEAAVHEGKYAEALKDYTAAGTANIRSAASFNNIGICYYELRDYNSAIKYFQMALDSNWQLGESYFNRGMAYYNKSVFDSASLNWLAATAFWDSCHSDTCRYFYKDALYSLGFCYKKLNQPEKALEYFHWLQKNGYEKDLRKDIDNLKWTLLISRKWYFLLAALVLALAIFILLRKYFKS